MKRFLFLYLFIVVAFVMAIANDRLYIENFSIQAGETLLVPVLLENDTIYSGLQTDLYLPIGLTLDMEDDEYIIDLTSRANRYHTAVGFQQTDGAIRIFVSSMSVKDFNDNIGPIMLLSLTAAYDFSGPATISLKNTICAESIGTKHVLSDEICIVNGSDEQYVPGDVDGDGQVNISDVTALIDILLNGDTGEALPTADVDRDGQINISDVTALIDLLLRGH